MAWLSNALETFRNAHIRSAAIRDLNKLPTAQLRDIGIAPDQIADIVDAMLRPTPKPRAVSYVTRASTSLASGAQAAPVGCG